MDNLDRDIREAQRLGYGVHYGHYKADHPYTADHSVDLVPKPDPLPVEEPTLCAVCGREFIPSYRSVKFCSDACRNVQKARKNAEWHQKHTAKPKEASCGCCGKSFRRERGGQRYCSAACKVAACRKRRNKEEKEA